MTAVTYEIISRYLIVLFLIVCPVNSIKLNVPRVLLPYSKSVSANFTLEVTNGGCFRWYMSRPEVIKIHMVDSENKGCSSKAIVSSTSKVPTLQSTLVTLINDETGETLHCDVSVTSISRLEITTTTRELLLEDTPEAFTIRALDKEGDTFSSLDGLVFDWNLITANDEKNSVEARYILRFIKFSESLYKASPAIYALDAQNKRGYTVLVQGIKTGSAIVRATLKDLAYSDGLSTEVVLSVVANLILYPSYEVHVLVGSIITYQVLVIQQGKTQRIVMPSSQFTLQLTNKDIASLNYETSEVEALSVGYTEVILKDLNVDAKQQLFRQPSAGIHVVAPHHIEFTLLPYQNWQLIREQRYIVLIKLYDRNNSEIFNTDNLRIEAEFPKDYFDIIFKTENGSYYEVNTLRTGLTKITARIKGVLRKDGQIIEPNQLIEDSQSLEIVDKVSIKPDLVILPWNPITKPTYTIQFEASGGGSTNYHWKVSNTVIANCNQGGSVSTKHDGSVNVTAASIRNQHNYAVATIHILRPFFLEILNSIVEIEVDKIVDIPIAIYTYFGEKRILTPFTDCVQYPVKVDIADPIKLQYLTDQTSESKEVAESCIALPVKGLQAGFTKLTVSFDSGEDILKNSTIIAIYKPLVPIFPVDDVVLLTLGASLSVVFQGGPRPWHLSPRNFFRNLDVDNVTVASAKLDSNFDSKIDDLHVFTITCNELGETTMILKVGNHKLSTNIRPVVSEAAIRVICQIPFAMELKPRSLQSKTPTRLCNFNEHRYPVHCYRELAIEVIMHDHEGRTFHNFTSIAVSWDLSNTSLATITSEKALLVIENVYDGYKTLNQTYQTLFPKNIEGSLKVTAQANSYLPHVSKFYEDENGFDLLSSIYLDLVDDAKFVEEDISVFNHPHNKVILSVTKGSGIFDFQPKDQSVASVIYDEKLHEFVIVPKIDGSFVLTLYDLCLDSRSLATAVVHVSGIRSIEVKMVDKVGINKEIEAFVRMLDKDQAYLPSSVFHLLDVKATPSSNIISVRPLSKCNSPKDVFCFAVLGKTLGQTMLTFSVAQKRISITESIIEMSKSSDPMPIQVFSPIRLHPRNVTLIIGATFQVLSSGGPMPQSSIEYSIENSKVASVTNAGIITGLKLGKTTITAKAIGIDLETGASVVYSKDQLNVFIIALTGIRIRTRLTRLHTGSTIPVFAIGAHDYETPFTFGSAVPTLRYKWSVSNKAVASLVPAYQQCGIHLQDDNQFMIRLEANNPGQVTLSLKVSVTVPSENGQHQIIMDDTLVDELQIEVFEKLRFIVPPFGNREIIMTPKTALKLVTNKDQSGFRLAYRLSDTTCPGDQDIVVDRNGNIISSQSICRSTLTVTSFDEVGFNQTISMLVVVKPVSYMMIVPTCSLHTKRESLFVLPVGTKSLFQVDFYDNFGNEFQATNSRLKFSVNRNDLLQLIQGPKNGTFYIKVNKPGHTILKVWDSENIGIDDYILILTGEIIKPQKLNLVLGEFVCFTSPLTSTEGEPGLWLSDNPNILKINPTTGCGFANDVGLTTVIHNTSVDAATNAEVNINPVQSVAFHSINSGKYLTNAFANKAHFFPLILRGGADETLFRMSNLQGHDCQIANDFLLAQELPYKCHLKFVNNVEESIDYIFDVSETFDINSGRHGCLVTSKAQTPELLQQVSTLKTALVMDAVVFARSQQDLITSDSLQITFNPAFYVIEHELYLSGDQTSANLTIFSTDNVFNFITLTSSDLKLLEVVSPQFVANDKSRKFLIRLSDRNRQKLSELPVSYAMTIDISCSLTNQTISIQVILKDLNSEFLDKCQPVTERSGWSGLFTTFAENYSNIIFTILMLFCTGIAVFIGYQAVVKSKAAQFQNISNRFGSAEGRLYPAGSRSVNGSHLSDSTHLWSVNEPVHGSPSFSRTPSPRFRNSMDRY